MSTAITIPKEYGYVLATATASFFISTWTGARVNRFRKAAGVPYPYPYATTQDVSAADTNERKQAMYLFNCAQRAHGNFLENYDAFLGALLLGGLKYPVGAAVAGAAWCVARVGYAVGYTRKDKEQGKGRYSYGGGLIWLAQLGLYVMTGMTAWKVVNEK